MLVVKLENATKYFGLLPSVSSYPSPIAVQSPAASIENPCIPLNRGLSVSDVFVIFLFTKTQSNKQQQKIVPPKTDERRLQHTPPPDVPATDSNAISRQKPPNAGKGVLF